MDWKCSSFSFDTTTPVVAGILNLTPDSFSDGGRFANCDEACACAHQMIEDGARIIDVGGESTRLGSVEVSPEEELSRVLPVVRRLAEAGLCVSIDTRHVSVAKACLEAGASIINDVEGFSDPALVELAAASDCGLVVVHNGTRADGDGDSDKGCLQGDIVSRVSAFLATRAAELEAAGIDASRICLDPGPGFGKTVRETIDTVRNFQEYARLGYPLMAALSRKSYLEAVYGIANPLDRDGVSASEALAACELGAGVVRTHNVPCTCQALRDVRPYVFLGLGCNMVSGVSPDSPENTQAAKKEQLNRAIAALCLLPDSYLVDVSSFYESEPAYRDDQPNFVNCVVLLRTGLPPKELIACLNAIEEQMGRVRTVKNGPRPSDIDILDYQRYVVCTELLTLPHPRVLEREFTVKPLLELRARHVLADGTPVTLDNATFGKSVLL